MLRIGINGFGRIGRTIAKINALEKKFQLVAINDINHHIDNMSYLLKYDSTHGKFPKEVVSTKDSIYIDHQQAIYSSKETIDQVDWDKLDVDVIIDASGVTQNSERARKIISKDGVKKVIVTHSTETVDKEIILGVNEKDLNNSHSIISNSICDANAIAHPLNWIEQEYGIETGSVTTLHPWLSYQNLVDGPAISQSNPGVVWQDYALGRASNGSIIPKRTTAMSATERVLPQLKGKIASFSYRIPTAIVASSDLTIKTTKTPSADELRTFIENKIMKSKYVVQNRDSLVSVDYEQNPASAIIDMQWLQIQNGLIKIILWYDNEWGYSSRVLDLVEQAVNSETNIAASPKMVEV